MGDCTRSDLSSLLGSRTGFEREGMVARALYNMDRDPGPLDLPLVRIISFWEVCEVPGLRRDTISSISMMIRYKCIGAVSIGCTSTSRNRREQFSFDCVIRNNGMGPASFYPPTSIGVVRTLQPYNGQPWPQGPQEDSCGLCLNPTLSHVPGIFVGADPVTFCACK